MAQEKKIHPLHFFTESSVDISPSQLDSFAESMGEKAFCRLAAEQLVAFAHPEEALPEGLRKFQLLVKEGIVFFLSRISYERLRDAIIAQTKLPLASPPGERLLHLALHFPTLHKLGQIIARNPGLDSKLKNWLIQLERGTVHENPSDIKNQIVDQLAGNRSASDFLMSSRILAEASVAAVVPFTWKKQGPPDKFSGVFKVLKKNISSHLTEELNLLSETMTFLEKDRARYGLREMMLADLITDVQNSMAKEVDLAAERENLVEAARIYQNNKGIFIPRLLSLQTPDLTSMEYLDGARITDTNLTVHQKKTLANLVFEAVICIPLFSPEDPVLFHGDPHAGNILALSTAAGPAVALIDWTLADRLSKIQRGHIVEMMTWLSTGDHRRLGKAIDQLCGVALDPANIEQMLASACQHDDPIKIAFHLLEEMTMEGIVMPPELVLFRKAFFTLEGVLNDLSPEFSMYEAMSDYLGRLILAELPERVGSGLFSGPDVALKYRSLLSNDALTNLGLHHALAVWEKAMSFQFAIFEAQTKLSGAFLTSMTNPF